MKNKKIIIGIIAIVLIIVIAIISFIIIKNNEQKQVSNLLIEYFNLINDQNYDAMYEKVASMNLSKDDFLARNKNIYEGIDAKNIKIEIEQIEKNSNNYQVSYNEHMYTAAGEIKFSNTATIVKENNNFKIQWSSKMIFPELEETDKVRISSIKAKRGEILDRNGIKLAMNGQIASVGIVPRKTWRRKQGRKYI